MKTIHFAGLGAGAIICAVLVGCCQPPYGVAPSPYAQGPTYAPQAASPYSSNPTVEIPQQTGGSSSRSSTSSPSGAGTFSRPPSSQGSGSR